MCVPGSRHAFPCPSGLTGRSGFTCPSGLTGRSGLTGPDPVMDITGYYR